MKSKKLRQNKMDMTRLLFIFLFYLVIVVFYDFFRNILVQ